MRSRAEDPLRVIIADRIRASSAVEGQTPAAVDALVDGVVDVVYAELERRESYEW